jgi:hypothetical protein
MGIKPERIKEVLRTKYYKSFCKFMEGQTMDSEGIYEDDFIRWMQKLPVID